MTEKSGAEIINIDFSHDQDYLLNDPLVAVPP